MDEDWNETLEHRLLHRLMFFTDAVFAIVMTLLALELRPPTEDAAQRSGLASIGAPLFAFCLSFAIAGVFWLAHMATTRRLRRFDWPTAVANLVFLLPICLIPFVSAWVGQAVTTARAWGAYSLVMIGCSAANIALILVQSRGGGRLMGGVSSRERLYRVGRAASPGLAWAIGLTGALAGQPRVAMVCWVLIPVLTRVCAIFLRPKPEPATAAREREAV